MCWQIIKQITTLSIQASLPSVSSVHCAPFLPRTFTHKKPSPFLPPSLLPSFLPSYLLNKATNGTSICPRTSDPMGNGLLRWSSEPPSALTGKVQVTGPLPTYLTRSLWGAETSSYTRSHHIAQVVLDPWLPDPRALGFRGKRTLGGHHHACVWALKIYNSNRSSGAVVDSGTLWESVF